MAVASMVVGIFSLVIWLLPICGMLVVIAGLVMGIVAWNSAQHGKAIAGMVMTVIGIIATVINAAAGAAMFMQKMDFSTLNKD